MLRNTFIALACVVSQLASADDLFKGRSTVVLKEQVHWTGSTFSLFSKNGAYLGQLPRGESQLAQAAIDQLDGGPITSFDEKASSFSATISNEDGTLITLSDPGTNETLYSLRRSHSKSQPGGDEWTISCHKKNSLKKNVPIQIAAAVSSLERQKNFSAWLKDTSKKLAISATVIVTVGLVYHFLKLKRSNRELRNGNERLRGQNSQIKNEGLASLEASTTEAIELKTGLKQAQSRMSQLESDVERAKSLESRLKAEHFSLLAQQEAESDRREVLENYAQELEYLANSPLPVEMRQVLTQEARSHLLSTHQEILDIPNEQVEMELGKLKILRVLYRQISSYKQFLALNRF